MNIENILKTVGIPVKYYEYSGTGKEYIVYNEELEQPVNYSDNLPRNRIIYWQVHLFTPKSSDFRQKKNQIVKILKDAGYLVTDFRTLFERETKTIHVVISCHEGESEE